MKIRMLALPLALALPAGLVACTQGGAQAPATGTAKAEAKAEAAPEKAAPAEAAGSTKGLSRQTREDVDADGVVRRGIALSDGTALSVGELHDKAGEMNGKSVKVTGEVAQVCQKSGCWFALRDGDKTIRITSKGYKYFVPSGAAGMTAVVEGEIAVKTLDVKEAQHYADDAAEATGKPAEKVTAPVQEIAIASIGLEMRKGE